MNEEDSSKPLILRAIASARNDGDPRWLLSYGEEPEYPLLKLIVQGEEGGESPVLTDTLRAWLTNTSQLQEQLEYFAQYFVELSKSLLAIEWLKIFECELSNDWYYKLIGVCYESLGDYPSAENWYRLGLEKNSESALLLNCLALLYRHQSQARKSEQILNQLLANNPADSRALTTLGIIARDRGEFEKAQHVFKKPLMQVIVITKCSGFMPALLGLSK